MSVTVTHLTSGFDTTNVDIATTASVSPSGPVLIAVGTNDVSTPTELPTISGLGLTWTQVGSAIQMPAATNYNMSLWIGTGTPSTGSITIDFVDPMNQISWTVVELDGEDASPVVQAEEAGTAAAATALTVTLPGAIGSGNATVGFIIRNLQEDVVPGSGYTELGESQGNLPDITIESMWRADGQTTVNWSWTTSGRACAIAVEIADASGITGVVDATEGDDTISASGTFTPGFSGVIAVAEGNDTASASGTVGGPPVSGAIAAAEGDDTVSATGTFSAFPARDITVLDFEEPFLAWETGKPATALLTATHPEIAWTAEEPASGWDVSAPTT